jgi:hypothetical protein
VTRKPHRSIRAAVIPAMYGKIRRLATARRILDSRREEMKVASRLLRPLTARAPRE